jgi:hypothetical protein
MHVIQPEHGSKLSPLSEPSAMVSVRLWPAVCGQAAASATALNAVQAVSFLATLNQAIAAANLTSLFDASFNGTLFAPNDQVRSQPSWARVCTANFRFTLRSRRVRHTTCIKFTERILLADSGHLSPDSGPSLPQPKPPTYCIDGLACPLTDTPSSGTQTQTMNLPL